MLLPVAVFLIWSSRAAIESQGDIVYAAGFFVFSAGGGALVGYVRGRALGGLFLAGMVAAYVGAILAALYFAMLMTPSLSLIRIDTQVGSVNDCSGSRDKVFVKLSESYNYWHVYIESGLFAIPFNEVGIVRYLDCPSFRKHG